MKNGNDGNPNGGREEEEERRADDDEEEDRRASTTMGDDGGRASITQEGASVNEQRSSRASVGERRFRTSRLSGRASIGASMDERSSRASIDSLKRGSRVSGSRPSSRASLEERASAEIPSGITLNFFDPVGRFLSGDTTAGKSTSCSRPSYLLAEEEKGNWFVDTWETSVGAGENRPLDMRKAWIKTRTGFLRLIWGLYRQIRNKWASRKTQMGF